LPRADLEEAATILGRSFSPDRVGRELDVVASLRKTLASGMQPHLVFRPRRVQQTILVLQDVSQSMAPHARRVDGLYTDLVRQGIAVERWFFDDDVSILSRKPFGVAMPLERLLRTREDGPVMILSAGFGASALVQKADREWMLALRKREARVWINPVTDPNLWPAAMARLPILIVPLTRAGLLQAARILAHGEQAATALGRVARRPKPVTPEHIRRLKQLASLVPIRRPICSSSCASDSHLTFPRARCSTRSHARTRTRICRSACLTARFDSCFETFVMSHPHSKRPSANTS
jgi:hypothetical protein